MIPVFLLKYYYQMGVYGIKTLAKEVEKNNLSQQDFYDITHYVYKSYIKQQNQRGV